MFIGKTSNPQQFEIQARDLKAGYSFKTSARQRKWRHVGRIYDLAEVSTPRPDEVLVCLKNECRQVVLKKEQKIFVFVVPFETDDLPFKSENL